MTESTARAELIPENNDPTARFSRDERAFDFKIGQCLMSAELSVFQLDA